MAAETLRRQSETTGTEKDSFECPAPLEDNHSFDIPPSNAELLQDPSSQPITSVSSSRPSFRPM